MTDYTSETCNDNNSVENSEWGGGENGEWQEFWDEQAQGKYWYNNISGEASWTRPFGDSEEYNTLGSVGSAAGASSTPVGAMGPNADDWVSSVDDVTGQEYWYNVKTGESSWA